LNKLHAVPGFDYFVLSFFKRDPRSEETWTKDLAKTYLNFADDEKIRKECISRKERQGRQDLICQKQGAGEAF
jgi:hypothetical protein